MDEIEIFIVGAGTVYGIEIFVDIVTNSNKLSMIIINTKLM